MVNTSVHLLHKREALRVCSVQEKKGLSDSGLENIILVTVFKADVIIGEEEKAWCPVLGLNSGRSSDHGWIWLDIDYIYNLRKINI